MFLMIQQQETRVESVSHWTNGSLTAVCYEFVFSSSEFYLRKQQIYSTAFPSQGYTNYRSLQTHFVVYADEVSRALHKTSQQVQL